MQKKKVLFLGPQVMGINNDIIDELELQGYKVDWVESGQITPNPYIRVYYDLFDEIHIKEYQLKAEKYWKDYFALLKDSAYDFFFSIDGMMVCPYLFEKLKDLNPSVKTILYMFDRIEGVYQVDGFFKYYDKVYSFDLGDCSSFHLKFLPIYWKECSNDNEVIYDIFGLAGYDFNKRDRTALYKKVRSVAKKNGLKEYIRLYTNLISNIPALIIRNFVTLFVRRNHHLPLGDILSGVLTSKSMSPDEFRKAMNMSKAILDTQAVYQDGLTARFMWALGQEKKIVTTNKSIKKYPFYTPEQFFVLEDGNYDGIASFINIPFQMSENNRATILQYRIDNWVKTLFAIE